MANLTITAGNVVSDSAASRDFNNLAGEAISAGQAVYLDPTTKKWMLADNNSATVAARKAGGIALNGAALNQPLAVHKAGLLTMGATLTLGATYFLSDTAGAICPDADVGSGEYVCQLGIAVSTTQLLVDIQFPGIAR